MDKIDVPIFNGLNFMLIPKMVTSKKNDVPNHKPANKNFIQWIGFFFTGQSTGSANLDFHDFPMKYGA